MNLGPLSRILPQAKPQEDVVITHEDVDRAHDRVRVSEARAQRGFFSRFRLLWLLVGPGILVMLGENDGPSMISYAATGARFGIGFFIPFVILTFCMAIVVQEMTMRLGSATHRGHAELIFDRFGPFWGWFSMIDLGIGNFLTLITQFIAIRAGLGFFGVPPLGCGRQRTHYLEAAPRRFEPRHSDHRAGRHRRNCHSVDALLSTERDG